MAVRNRVILSSPTCSRNSGSSMPIPSSGARHSTPSLPSARELGLSPTKLGRLDDARTDLTVASEHLQRHGTPALLGRGHGDAPVGGCGSGGRRTGLRDASSRPVAEAGLDPLQDVGGLQ